MTKKQILQILNDKSTYILDFKDETHNAIEFEDFNDVADAILSLCSSSLQLKEEHKKGIEELELELDELLQDDNFRFNNKPEWNKQIGIVEGKLTILRSL